MRFVTAVFALLLPAVALGGEGYPDVSGVAERLSGAESGHPESVRVFPIGSSLGGRPIRAVLCGLPGDRPLEERPRLLVVAGLRADHRVGTAVAGLLPGRLFALADDDPEVAARLRTFAVEIVPLVNPDALADLVAGPERVSRTNLRPVDHDRDGLVDEDGPADLDGDGRITTIRVPDPAGDFRISDEDPRLLVKVNRAKGEKGAYRVLPEGLDDDGDGKIAEDGSGGVDLDRNFAHGFDLHDRETGVSSPSEPESRALLRHVLDQPNIACVLVYGARDTLATVPEKNGAGRGKPPNGPMPGDRPFFEEAHRRFTEITGGKGGGKDGPDGAFHQWVYYQLGVPAFSTPVFYPKDGEEPPLLPEGKKPTSEDGRRLARSDALGGSGFTDWADFEHPTLGRVQIGGLAPLFAVNPPAEELPDLADEQARFVASLLELFPRISLANAKAKPLGGGAYEVSADLFAEGVFPVVTEMGRTTKAGMPVRVEIDLDADSTLQGKRRTLLWDLTKPHALRWVIRGKPGDSIRLTAVSEKTGPVSVEVKL